MNNKLIKLLACCLVVAFCFGCGSPGAEPTVEPTQEIVEATPEPTPTVEPEPTPEPTPEGISAEALDTAIATLFEEMAAFNWKGKATDYIAEHPDYASQGGDITSSWDAMVRYDFEIDGETFSKTYTGTKNLFFAVTLASPGLSEDEVESIKTAVIKQVDLAGGEVRVVWLSNLLGKTEFAYVLIQALPEKEDKGEKARINVYFYPITDRDTQKDFDEGEPYEH